jgi:hypothetical protein
VRPDVLEARFHVIDSGGQRPLTITRTSKITGITRWQASWIATRRKIVVPIHTASPYRLHPVGGPGRVVVEYAQRYDFTGKDIA